MSLFTSLFGEALKSLERVINTSHVIVRRGMKNFEVSPTEFDIQFMREHGYVRKCCKSCGSFFWTCDPDLEVCMDAPCVEYQFIDNSPTRARFDVNEMRSVFLKFFEKHGHTVIDPYPVVARWRDDLFVTIASIVDFQPYVTDGITDPPANPLVVSQPCMRFEDIDRVGLTYGRHLTIFEMGGAHAFNLPGREIYWKDRTIELHHKLATEELGIPEEFIVYKEHFWSGGGNAGPDVEAAVLGLEISTLVFMSYKVIDDKLVPTKVRTVDTGYGIERWSWLTQGTPTAFEPIYGPIYRWLIAESGLKPDESAIKEFARISASATRQNVKTLRAEVAKRCGFSLEELHVTLSAYEDLCTALDHSKGLVFLLAEGVVPSNVREGYLARMLERRLLRLLERRGVVHLFEELLSRQIDYWGKIFPSVREMSDEIIQLALEERKKYEKSLAAGTSILAKELREMKRRGLTTATEDLFVKYYESHGLPLEVVSEVLDEYGISYSVPSDLLGSLAKRHGERAPEVAVEVGPEIPDHVPQTLPLFYEDPYLFEFTAKVVHVVDNFVVLDRTAFYPTGGGQLHDTGVIEHSGGLARVVEVQRAGHVILHRVEGPLPPNGEIVKCRVDKERRLRLMRNHTATHIVLGAARRVLGRHVWQAGAEKKPDRARLDVTHPRRITKDEVRRIEALANEIVARALNVEVAWMDRTEAERRYGMTIYQGGVVPEAKLRVVKIEDWDVEACGGTHCSRTDEVGAIKIISVDRIQDGIERITFTTSVGVVEEARKWEDVVAQVAEKLGVPLDKVPEAVGKKVSELEEAEKVVKRLSAIASKALAEAALSSSKPIGRLRLAQTCLSGVSIDLLVSLGKEIAKRAPDAVYVGVNLEPKLEFIVVCGDEAIRSGASAREVASRFSKIIGGGSGGDDFLARGGGVRKERVEEALRAVEGFLKTLS